MIFEIEEDGIVGRGEAAPLARYGESAESAAAALDQMAAGLAEPAAFAEEAARLAVPGQNAAAAAFDMALHDLAARRLGIPVRELLGIGNGRSRPPRGPSATTRSTKPWTRWRRRGASRCSS